MICLVLSDGVCQLAGSTCTTPFNTVEVTSTLHTANSIHMMCVDRHCAVSSGTPVGVDSVAVATRWVPL